MPRHTNVARCLLLLLAIAASNPASARHGRDDDEIGHEAAKELLESGRILALETILAKVSERVPGKLIETKLEYEHGRIMYDLKILRPDGRVQEVEVDAATGEIIKIEDDD
ncbi:MAG: peptidase [Hyphomicrobium sp.]|jgi:uncharacterized membrane protein YkoI|nr:peptidase [Hyphomicrobium sp.]PPD08100.1 MAG: peptidase [Hyphomicrobium sp.]